MQKTETYQFNLIEGSDPFSQEPINENTKAIETLLTQISTNSARLAVGSYVGNSITGEDTPNTLTFDFEPKVVLILLEGSSIADDYHSGTLMIRPNTKCATGAASDYRIHVTWGDRDVSWYSEYGHYAQLNVDGWTYHYFALG